jgi:protocatechuate 3,4-dioxygenase beta subunit
MSGDGSTLDRRRFLRLMALTPVVVAVTARVRWRSGAEAAFAGEPDVSTASLTPECGDDDEPTPSETAGPFFKPRSPLRASLLEAGMAGTPIVVEGRVFSRGCKPLANVLLDFWHADDSGEYDNQGFRCRGHQFTDASGHYKLETVIPGLYPGRTRHIHVRVQAPKGKILTTQLYFPNEPRNENDGLFRPELLMSVKDVEKAKQGRFHFLLDAA